MCLLRHFGHLPRPPGHPMLLGSLFLAIFLFGTMSSDGAADWDNPWNPQDELRPYRLRERRVHDRGLAKRQPKPNGAKLSADWQWPEPEQPEQLDQLPLVGPFAELAFRANQTRLSARTDTWMMRHSQCLEVRFRVEGKRTRLLLYTCHMAEGGMCVLDKFLATTATKLLDSEGPPGELDSCHKLQPWMFSPAPFSFHIRFVRRPRRFAERAALMRHWRRRYGRHATREVGRVRLNGFRACNRACSTEGDTEGPVENIPLAGGNYFEDPRQGWRRR